MDLTPGTVKKDGHLLPFQPIPQCAECLQKLARSSIELTGETNSALISRLENEAEEILEGSRDRGMSSPQIANLILRRIRQASGVYDPYAEFKAQEMSAARKILSRLKGHVGAELRSRITLAVLGNSLDFFKDPEEALAEIPAKVEQGLSFYYDDIVRLEAFLSDGPRTVLYMADNAGEIYFDLPLYDYVRERAGRAVLVVKGGPSLNDLTRRELELAKLEKRFDEVADTGTDGAGIDWEGVSDGFLDLVKASDLIISKGMANFETIYPRKLPAPVFFLFRAKCQPIQDYLNAPPDSFLAFWKNGEDKLKAAGPSGIA